MDVVKIDSIIKYQMHKNSLSIDIIINFRTSQKSNVHNLHKLRFKTLYKNRSFKERNFSKWVSPSQYKIKPRNSQNKICKRTCPTYNFKNNFSTLSKSLALFENKCLLNSSLSKNGQVMLQKCNINMDLSAQDLDIKNRKEQRKKFKCDIEVCEEERKERENQDQKKGCCSGNLSPELKWAEDIPRHICYPSGEYCLTGVPLKKPKRLFEDEDAVHECPKPITYFRMDDNYKVLPKMLPTLAPKACPAPMKRALPACSKLPVLKKLYDDSKMKYPHICIKKVTCESSARLDDMFPIRYKRLERLQTPEGCKPCDVPKPTINPRLRRMKFEYIDQSKVCETIKCEWVEDKQKTYKKLTKVEFGNCPPPCQDFPTISPKLRRLQKRFKTSKFKFPHVCKRSCYYPPRRMDECLDILPKVLKKIKIGCMPPKRSIPPPIPKLIRPHKIYDDAIDQNKACPIYVCTNTRMDANIKTRSKKLMKYTELSNRNDCPPFKKWLPTINPPLAKLKKREVHDPIPDCPPPPEPCIRLDDNIRIERGILPEIPCSPCKKSKPFKPTLCPKIARLRRRTPILDRPECPVIMDTCNIDPPRLDDVCCLKPRAKILPPFNPKMYPPPSKTDPCCHDLSNLGNVCCFQPEPKPKSIFLPKKKPKVPPVEITCEGSGNDP